MSSRGMGYNRSIIVAAITIVVIAVAVVLTNGYHYLATVVLTILVIAFTI